MKTLIISIGLLLTAQLHAQQNTVIIPTKFNDSIPVLNMGTFHMGYSTDAHTTEFDEHNQENIRQIHEIARKIAEFKPTVIIVETPPAYNLALQQEYQEYLKNPVMKFESPSEIELLAYEVGRLSGCKQIYGIDYKESYNYLIGDSLKKPIDSVTVSKYWNMFEAFEQKYPEGKMKLLDALIMNNKPAYMDFMITINADILTHISSAGKAEGADEAAKYYHRNLVMYSNLNQLKLSKNDRIFILMGASHTAFFNDFMRRSPQYSLVDIFRFLK
ncbi:DUF5694 domain-containing protein [Fluviicola sp.]|uniref:DUF5694 domain-containing protein n=1 Tax=Fluviicola sp. TaxID=1917219 RepID=UPI00261FED7E|nr:DUF5694 domain-containing protein [Fluviicola sp.]